MIKKFISIFVVFTLLCPNFTLAQDFSFVPNFEQIMKENNKEFDVSIKPKKENKLVVYPNTSSHFIALKMKELYDDYNFALYNENWKQSKYAQKTPQELDEIIKNLSMDILTEMQENPYFIRANITIWGRDISLTILSFLIFMVIGEFAGAVLPSAGASGATLGTQSFIKGMAWDFTGSFYAKTLPKTAILCTEKLCASQKISMGLGAVSSMVLAGEIGDEFSNLADDLLKLNDYRNLAVDTRAVNQRLRKGEEFSKEFKEKLAETKSRFLPLSDKDKKTITEFVENQLVDETPYEFVRETIIKIHALEYISFYLRYNENPAKYLWALLDLSSIFFTADEISFDENANTGSSVSVPSARLVERNEDINNALEKVQIQRNILHNWKYDPKIREKAVERQKELLK